MSTFQLTDLVPLLATGVGAWSVFPKAPQAWLDLFDAEKNSYAELFSWFLVYVLIWQGSGGRDVGKSLIGTATMFLIAQAFDFMAKQKRKSIIEQLAAYKA